MKMRRIIGIREEENESLEAFPITRSRRLLGNKASEEPIMAEREEYSIPPLHQELLSQVIDTLKRMDQAAWHLY
jgi:hypothetical protein